jgi:hypothetical protein
MKFNFKYFIFFILFALVVTCKKPYNPPAISAPGSYLVVEGVINSGSDSTIIKLSKTVNLSSKTTTNPVLQATVTVESDQNNSYPLTETTKGNYVSGGLNLNNTQKYRLRIKTADSKEYLSDFVAVLNSPPIDTVSFIPAGNILNIYSGTHDPKNNTRYYRWDYTETWIFHAALQSFFKSNGDTVLQRSSSDQIYQCWQSDTSSVIVLGSSEKLAQDVIANNLVTSIASTSEKIGTDYSIRLRQYALTSDAYAFWQNLKKNTEQLGSIFDAQPSEISGNIHSVTNPAEPVIGYISVGSTSVKRIFITPRQLPAWLPAPSDLDCMVTSCLYAYFTPAGQGPLNQVDELINFNKGAGPSALIPVQAIQPRGSPTILGYTAASRECVDCTLRGTNKQPAYWQY